MQGIERAWASEYATEYAAEGLKRDAWLDASHPFYNSPKGPKDGTTFTDKGRAVRISLDMCAPALMQTVRPTLDLISAQRCLLGQCRVHNDSL